MNILFADDHPLLLDGLKNAVINKFPSARLFTAINKNELFDQLKVHPISILIQDLKFGDSNAKDFLKEIKSTYPNLKILILSSVSDNVSIQQMMQRANGYVIKSEPIEEIFNALEAFINNQNYLSAEVTKKLKELVPHNEIILTKREREVLAVIMKEKSIKEIALTLEISEKTVEMHRSNLFTKLDVKNITGLVKKVLALNLLEE